MALSECRIVTMKCELWSVWSDTLTDTQREIRSVVCYAVDEADARTQFNVHFGDVQDVHTAPGLVVTSLMRLVARRRVREAILAAPPRHGLIAEAHLRTLIPSRTGADPQPQWPQS